MDTHINDIVFPNIKSVYDQILNQKDHTLPPLADSLKKDILYLSPYKKEFYNFTNNHDKNIVNQRKFLYNFENNVHSDSGNKKDYYEQNSYETQLHLGYLLYTFEDYKNIQSLLLLGFEKNGHLGANEDSKFFGLRKVTNRRIPVVLRYQQPLEFKNSMDHLKHDNLQTHMDEKAFYKAIHRDDPDETFGYDIKETFKNMYEIGMHGLPLLLGYDKKLSIDDFQNQLLKVKDITMEAEWESSSHKQGFDIDALLDRDISSSWQSNGFLPHIIDVKFEKITKLNNILMFFCNTQNSSYAPFHIRIYGGTSELDLVLLKDFGNKRIEGFINFFFFDTNIKNKVVTEDNQKFKNIHGILKNGYVYNPPIEVRYLKIFIFSNRHMGKDSKLESIRLYQDIETNDAIDAINDKESVSTEDSKKERDWHDIIKKIKNKESGLSKEEPRVTKPKHQSVDSMMVNSFIV